MLGCLYWISGDQDRALSQWQASVPSLAADRLLKHAYSLGSQPEAELYFRFALRLRPKWWVAHYGLAIWCEVVGRSDLWRQSLGNALNDSDIPEFNKFLIRGRLAFADGNTSYAIDQLRQAVQLYPDYPWSRFYLAQALEANSAADALAEYSRLLALDRSFYSSLQTRIKALCAKIDQPSRVSLCGPEQGK
jgi:Flp pilus assembly protein TadD